MTRSITLADPWLHIAAAMAVPAYLLFLWSKQRLKKSAQELKGKRGIARAPFFFWQLRWQFAVGVVALAGAWAMVVGIHSYFVGIKADDTGLTMDYAWPRSDVRLSWADISEVAVDKKQFGTWRTTRFCLRVVAGDSVFYSPWSATAREVNQAHDSIQRWLTERKNRLPD